MCSPETGRSAGALQLGQSDLSALPYDVRSEDLRKARELLKHNKSPKRMQFVANKDTKSLLNLNTKALLWFKTKLLAIRLLFMSSNLQYRSFRASERKSLQKQDFSI